MTKAIEALFASISRFINATFFGGTVYQSISARAHCEGWKLQGYINALFFWQDDHCAMAWRSEVENARKVLHRAGLQ